MALCDADGQWPDAVPVTGTSLPAFAISVPDTNIVVVWVVVVRYSQLAIRFIYDVTTGERHGA